MFETNAFKEFILELFLILKFSDSATRLGKTDEHVKSIFFLMFPVPKC